MSKHVVCYFSGTGNCLEVAKQVASLYDDCEIVAMGKNLAYTLDETCESIGFVYPTYFLGLPQRVVQFIRSLNVEESQNIYCYGVTTYGGMIGNSLRQLQKELKRKKLRLHFGEKVRMVENYILLYSMKKDHTKIIKSAKQLVQKTCKQIEEQRTNGVGIQNPIWKLYYKVMMRIVPKQDRGFHVSEKCISCSICKDVCPVNNIEMKEGTPQYQHHCEQCMACLQYCPKQAINYKQKTQKRGRYVNPTISHQELKNYNQGMKR